MCYWRRELWNVARWTTWADTTVYYKLSQDMLISHEKILDFIKIGARVIIINSRWKSILILLSNSICYLHRLLLFRKYKCIFSDSLFRQWFSTQQELKNEIQKYYQKKKKVLGIDWISDTNLRRFWTRKLLSERGFMVVFKKRPSMEVGWQAIFKICFLAGFSSTCCHSEQSSKYLHLSATLHVGFA